MPLRSLASPKESPLASEQAIPPFSLGSPAPNQFSGCGTLPDREGRTPQPLNFLGAAGAGGVGENRVRKNWANQSRQQARLAGCGGGEDLGVFGVLGGREGLGVRGVAEGLGVGGEIEGIRVCREAEGFAVRGEAEGFGVGGGGEGVGIGWAG